jgi:hypothetical protein
MSSCAGMYMGELIRQVLVDLMKDDLIFVGADREKILERGSFYTRYASEIESDPVGEYTRAKQALEEMGIDPEEVTDDDCSALRSESTVQAVPEVYNGSLPCLTTPLEIWKSFPAAVNVFNLQARYTVQAVPEMYNLSSLCIV